MKDFNDIAKIHGLDAVQSTIENSIKNQLIKNGKNGGSYDVSIEEWPKLIPLDKLNLPAISPAKLTGWAWEYARALSQSHEVPFELPMGMILGSCSAAAARCLRVMVDPNYSEPCNLWLAVALPPGNRKSAVQKSATQPLLDWERDEFKRVEPEIKRLSNERKMMEARLNEYRIQAAKAKDPTIAKNLERQAAELEANLPKIPTVPQLWTSDATPEKLGSMLHEQEECMAWLSSEAGIFELLQGRYSNKISNLDLVLKAHSGDAERVD